jgi:hypothetical protein
VKNDYDPCLEFELLDDGGDMLSALSLEDQNLNREHNQSEHHQRPKDENEKHVLPLPSVISLLDECQVSPSNLGPIVDKLGPGRLKRLPEKLFEDVRSIGAGRQRSVDLSGNTGATNQSSDLEDSILRYTNESDQILSNMNCIEGSAGSKATRSSEETDKLSDLKTRDSEINFSWHDYRITPESPSASSEDTIPLSDTAEFTNPLGIELKLEPDVLETNGTCSLLCCEGPYGGEFDDSTDDISFKDSESSQSAEEMVSEDEEAEERLLEILIREEEDLLEKQKHETLPMYQAQESDQSGSEGRHAEITFNLDDSQDYERILDVKRSSDGLYHCPYPGCAVTGMTRWYNLKMHYSIHYGELLTPSSKSSSTALYLMHAFSNTGDATKPYTCDYCKKKFRRKFDMQRHVECLHGDHRMTFSAYGERISKRRRSFFGRRGRRSGRSL